MVAESSRKNRQLQLTGPVRGETVLEHLTVTQRPRMTEFSSRVWIPVERDPKTVCVRSAKGGSLEDARKVRGRGTVSSFVH